MSDNILESMGLNPLLRWLVDIIYLLGEEEIKVPQKYREQVLEVKELLEQDVSGLVNSILDFAINAALVDFSIETDNSNLTALLNNWLNTINYEYKGKIPVGIKALAKEYYRERWKGSSFLLLRTLWEKKDDILLPTALWFVDGEDIIVENGNNDVRVLGEEKYYLRISRGKKKLLPEKKNEKIFVQKPFSSWSSLEPVPFLIQRGIFKNLKLLALLEKKGEFVVSKALEYLMVLKKGTERLALTNNPDFIYNEEDLRKIKEDLQDFLKKRTSESGTPVYTTGFDTEIEHIIPEYRRILEQELYTPIERRILAGLGVIEVIRGYGASSRLESIFNPKPFIAEVEAAIEDFKTLLMDIIYTIIDLNAEEHPKYFKGNNKIRVNSTLIKHFITDDLRTMLRSLYDRGLLSKQTAIEVLGNVDFEIEKKRRKKEMKEGLDIIFYPPVIVNREQDISPEEELRPLFQPELEDQNKTGVEKRNYFMSNESENDEKVYEEAPYKNINELPDRVKNNMSEELQEIFLKVVNNALKRYNDDTIAFKVAWSVIKKIAKKNKEGKWVLKSKLKTKSAKEIIDLFLEGKEGVDEK